MISASSRPAPLPRDTPPSPLDRRAAAPREPTLECDYWGCHSPNHQEGWGHTPGRTTPHPMRWATSSFAHHAPPPCSANDSTPTSSTSASGNRGPRRAATRLAFAFRRVRRALTMIRGRSARRRLPPTGSPCAALPTVLGRKGCPLADRGNSPDRGRPDPGRVGTLEAVGEGVASPGSPPGVSPDRSQGGSRVIRCVTGRSSRRGSSSGWRYAATSASDRRAHRRSPTRRRVPVSTFKGQPAMQTPSRPSRGSIGRCQYSTQPSSCSSLTVSTSASRPRGRRVCACRATRAADA